MTLNKVLIGALCALSLGFTACSDDDDDNRSEFDGLKEYSGVFVINQGSVSYSIPGSITNIDTKSGEAYQDVFKTVNGRVLGDTPQSAIIHGDKMYVAVYDSNIIEVLDSKTLKSIKTIKPTGEGQSPRYFAAKGDKVYVSFYDGYVGRIDTKSLEIDAKVKVGENPEALAVGGNDLYVPNSAGLNGMSGTTVSKIDLSSFTNVATIEVGMNPVKVVTYKSDFYVLCMGDYADIMNTLYKVSEVKGKYEMKKLFEASKIALKGNILYGLNSQWSHGVQLPTTYCAYNLDKEEKSELNLTGLASAVGLGVNPKTGNIYVSSYTSASGWAEPMYVNEYKSNGTLVKRYDVGMNAEFFVF